MHSTKQSKAVKPKPAAMAPVKDLRPAKDVKAGGQKKEDPILSSVPPPPPIA
jgi:hypothetical protein